MLNIEEINNAIEYFQALIDRLGASENQVCVTALEALREYAERQKGCTACEGRYRDEKVSDNYCSGCGKHLPPQAEKG